MSITTTLERLGFSDKESKIYLALLQRGPSSVRQLAAATDINRGTTYDVLKSLIASALVSHYHKETRQYFTAENPTRLKQVVAERTEALQRADEEITAVLPELQSLYVDKEKPVVKYYEGGGGIKTILEDVLRTMSSRSNKEYFVYSTADVRAHLYQDFPNFAKERVRQNIPVKTIAIGAGGKLWGLDERRWLTGRGKSPSYQIIYAEKFSLISLNPQQQPRGVIIEDAATASTQRLIFQELWSHLKPS